MPLSHGTIAYVKHPASPSRYSRPSKQKGGPLGRLPQNLRVGERLEQHPHRTRYFFEWRCVEQCFVDQRFAVSACTLDETVGAT